jgi:hypothetical protein
VLPFQFVISREEANDFFREGWPEGFQIVEVPIKSRLRNPADQPVISTGPAVLCLRRLDYA